MNLTRKVLKKLEGKKHTNCQIVFGSGYKSKYKCDLYLVSDVEKALKEVEEEER